ncbi:hypothetical protein MAM1_0152d06705 [Mucor ambiguus]|uniref:Uncharacterized protein n=1 Tax=Mucor ambiguus TaxID=91626 RepID=A0A0C9MUU1_9FUNG|nr:hypothetical protein MAM1_0152d06705 [Mucor ambiguus]
MFRNQTSSYQVTMGLLQNQRNMIDNSTSLTMDQKQMLQQLNKQLKGMLTTETAQDISNIISVGGVVMSYAAAGVTDNNNGIDEESRSNSPVITVLNRHLPSRPQVPRYPSVTFVKQEVAEVKAIMVSTGTRMRTLSDLLCKTALTKLRTWSDEPDVLRSLLFSRRKWLVENEIHGGFVPPEIAKRSLHTDCQAEATVHTSLLCF